MNHDNRIPHVLCVFARVAAALRVEFIPRGNLLDLFGLPIVTQAPYSAGTWGLRFRGQAQQA